MQLHSLKSMKSRVSRSVRLGVGLVAMAIAISPLAAPAADNVVLRWNQTTLDTIGAVRGSPTVSSRAIGIVGTAMYDAWAPYDSKALGTQLGGSLRQDSHARTLANKQKAISYAAYRVLTDLYPSETARFNALMAELGYDPADTSTNRHTPAGVGNTVAAALLAMRHNDGSNQLGDLHPGAYSDYTGYVPVNGPDTPVADLDPNHWQALRTPTSDGGTVVQTPLSPHWGLVQPFSVVSAVQLRPTQLPAMHPSDAYRIQVEELVSISANLDEHQKVIADYWADGPHSWTPPGHWQYFAQQVSRRRGHTLDQDVKLFFAMGNAVMDGGIVAWDSKFHFDYVRPVTAIHYFYNNVPITAWMGHGLGTGTILGQDWKPYQKVNEVTPPFPEYISGHSIFSAASAEVLKSFTGSDEFGESVTIPAGGSGIEPGLVPSQPITLSWATFSEAADEAGVSRKYGGIHFTDGDLVSRATGRKVGAAVWAKVNSYINGTASPEHHGEHR